MVYKYLWPWDNPWTSCRSWVITPSILKNTEHPQPFMLNNSQPGINKGLCWGPSGQTQRGHPPSHPWAQTTEGVPSQGSSGSAWHGLAGLALLLEEPILPSHPVACSPPQRTQGLGFDLDGIAFLTPCLHLLWRHCPTSAFFFSALRLFYFI